MSELSPNFDLHYDLETIKDLEIFVDHYDDVRSMMRLMVNEIKSRDETIKRLEFRIDLLKKLINEENDVILPNNERIDNRSKGKDYDY